MLYGAKSKQDLDKHAEKLFKENENIKKRKLRQQLYDNIERKFGFPPSLIEEMITFKKDISEFTPFQVFAVVWFLDMNSLSRFFTENEIAELSNSKYEVEVASFPQEFDDMVQITDDQFIGKITVQKLMSLKRSRMINYDENEQRALRRVKSGEIEIYKPFVNAKSVAEIKESMLNGSYIPDPITLNMPEGSEFTYENHKLIIYSLPKGMFNLDDGYHRYLAMSQIIDFNPDFDYTMELRIVNFSNVKANNFIFQQDQKTLMKRIVSETYNMDAVPNKITQRLNEDSSCNISGMIGRNNAKINSAVLSKLIAYFYKTASIKKEDTAKSVVTIEKELCRKFNIITDQDDRFFEKYSDVMLFVIIYVFNNSEISEDDYAEKIMWLIDNLSDNEYKVLNVASIGSVRRKGINILNEKIGGDCSNV